MMNANCLDCNANFLVSPGVVVSGACPHCGGKRLERDQPSPTHSDGELRNMVNPDTGMDQGGNPLMEGILGGGEGWQPYTRRDESFAKVANDQVLWGIANDVLQSPGVTLLDPHSAQLAGMEVINRAHQWGLNINENDAVQALKLAWSVLYHNPTPAGSDIDGAQVIRQRRPYEDDMASWHPGEDMANTPDPQWLNTPIQPVPPDLQARLPRQHNYGSTMDHNSRTLNMEPYDSIWGTNPEPNLHLAGPLLGLAGGMLGADALPFLMRGALMGTGSHLVGDLLGGGQQQQQQPGGLSMPPPRDLAQVSHVAAGEDGNIPVETPTSNPGYYHDDPQEIDQHEFDDQSTSLNQNNPEPSGEAGGAFTDVSNPGNEVAGTGVDKPGFSNDSPGLERARLLVPLLQHYHSLEESGANDPMIRELHEVLERENPGYLKNVGPEHAHAYETWLQNQREPDAIHAKVADWGTQQNFAPGMGLTAQPGGGIPGVGQQGKCPYCGGVQTANGHCPQCGAQAPLGNGQMNTMPQMQSQPGLAPAGQAPTQTVAPGGYRSHTAAGDTQGPQTPEQILAVQDYLRSQGRDQEIHLVQPEPWRFTRELAEIAQRPNLAPQLPPGAAPAQPPMDPSMMMGQQPPGGMPPPMPSPMGHVAADWNQFVPGQGTPFDYHDDQSPQNLQAEFDPRNQNTNTPGGYASTCAHCESNNTVRTGPFHHYCLDCGNTYTPFIQPRGEMDANDQLRRVWSPDDVGYPTVGPTVPPQSTFNHLGPTRLGADNIAGRCPNCGSGTTGVLNTKGDSRCHACGYTWEEPGAMVEKISAPASPMTEDSSNVVGVPAADQQQMMDPEQQQDSSMTFQDTSGQPLVPGTQYEMHSANYMVPDIVRVDQVKPDEITVTTIGEFQGDPNNQQKGMEYQHKVTAQTAKEYGVTFQPMDNNDSDAGDQSLQEYSDKSQGPVHTEPSAIQSSTQHEAYGGPMIDQDPRGQYQVGQTIEYVPAGGGIGHRQHTESGTIVGFQSSGYTPGDPFVQNRFGQVKVVTRRDILPPGQQIMGAVEEVEEEEKPTDRCPVCTSSHITSSMSSPTNEFHECYRCGNSWETRTASVEAGPDATRDWLMADDPDDDFFANFERFQAMEAAGQQSRSISAIASNDARYQAIKQRLNENKAQRKEAGRNFSPREQRDFIDERGSARNSDLLDLEDTHYALKDDWETKGNAFNVPEEHLFMGL